MTTKTERPKAKSGLKTLAALLPFLSPYKKQIFIAAIALVVAAASTLTIPYGFRQLID
jgi:ATP-binding cassette subfamily B protein